MSSELMHYIGPSMNPTLSVGDGLKVLPYHGRKVHAGDVVVFPHPQQKYNVVHRVVRVDGTGIWTRGDNNNEDDPWSLQPEQIIGQVVSLAGGARGHALAIYIRTWNQMRKWTRLQVARCLRPLYRVLARSGLIQQYFGRWVRPRVVSYARAGGVELVLFLGRREVGKLRAGEQRWQIRAPWRLVVDEASLPQKGACN
jgi:hypothetical protein